MKRLLLSFATLVLSAGLCQAAFADPFSLTLSNANQSTVSSAALTYLTYSGTITNTSGSTIFLNGIGFNSSSFSSVDSNPGCTTGNAPCTDETAFFSSPAFLANGSSYTGVLFSVDVPSSAAIMNYSGFVDIVGGPDAFTNSQTSTIVGFSTTVTPEPSSWLLMATGLIGLAVASRFRPQDASSLPSNF